ncbi:MAG: cobyrinate a,c-diamide synthase [Hyphomicrobium sp.]
MTAALSLPPGLMIAAPRSGAGKTTITLGLLRAFKRRGFKVQPFKAGPDYIDPAFHAVSAGRKSYNLDSWAMRLARTAGILENGCAGADLVIVEALMGLFDGVMHQGQWGTGTSADVAAATGWPVVLVLDVSGQSQTAAAATRGFIGFRKGVNIAGVILNRVGSERHIRLASAALENEGLTILGALPRNSSVVLPERHLGLVQAEETSDLEQRLDALADFIEAHVDIAAVLAKAVPGRIEHTTPVPAFAPGQRIALARDAAFSFVYPHVIAGWRMAGAEIIPFSPLQDEIPDARADVVWLPGGYPELYAGQIAGAHRFKSAIQIFAQTRPVHGECGGYMTLGTGLIDASGTSHEMLGLLGLETSFKARKMQLGYRKAGLLADCVLGTKGSTVRGHEFHYATILAAPDEPLFRMEDAGGEVLVPAGSRKGWVTGSFFHFIDN